MDACKWWVIINYRFPGVFDYRSLPIEEQKQIEFMEWKQALEQANILFQKEMYYILLFYTW